MIVFAIFPLLVFLILIIEIIDSDFLILLTLIFPNQNKNQTIG